MKQEMTGRSTEQKSLSRNTDKRVEAPFLYTTVSFTDKFSLDTKHYTKHFNYVYICILLMLNIHANYINVCCIYLSNYNISNSFLKLPLVLVLTYLWIIFCLWQFFL